ncbi:hypothetical protein D3C75_979110 [compost metagenome]
MEAVLTMLGIGELRMAEGSPVAGLLITIMLCARGRPAWVLSGKLEIHLIPAAFTVPPTYAGMAIIRFCGFL